MPRKSLDFSAGRKLLVGIILGLLVLGLSGQASLAAEIELSDTSPRQGQTVQIFVTLMPDEIGHPPGREPLHVQFGDDSYKLYPDQSDVKSNEAVKMPTGARRYRTLMSVPADFKPGTYNLVFGDFKKPIKVVSANFQVQKIRLPKSKDSFKASPGEKEAITSAKNSRSSRRLWNGQFSRPCKGRTSASFGLRRMVNGRLLDDYFHTGLDFAAPKGTPVKAPADGVVILSKTGWRLHGNTVCLDHGQGVVTIYIHLNNIKVDHGQEVDKGDVIGTVGSTGRASGPHLHFGLYVNSVATNPVDWFNKVF